MSDQQRWRLRWGLLNELVAQAAPPKLGRTAIMKIAYFLQTVQCVPLGYNFWLYTYGRFDSDVLSDLWQLESLGAVKSHMVTFVSGSGYGYEFTPGPEQAAVRELAGDKHVTYREAMRWALQELAPRTEADLELISTIVFADREAVRERQQMSFAELCRQVKAVKPRFAEGYILDNIKELAEKELLQTSRELD
jgi:hypothetical protein